MTPEQEKHGFRPENLTDAQQKAADDYIGPKAVCTCRHLGDGEGVAENSTVSTHKNGGQGACTYRDCPCDAFTWKRYTKTFERVLELAG